MMLESIFDSFISAALNVIGSLGYLGIGLLMTIESTVIPFPAELILVPAGVLVAQGELSFVAVLAMATLGSVAGALINYFIAWHLGRRAVNHLLTKYERIFFLNHDHIIRSEKFFASHGEITTLLGRLIPGFRSFVSLPAGFTQMNVFRFCLFTAVGAGLWSALLIALGMIFGNNLEVIRGNLNTILLWCIPIFILVIAIYWVWHKKHRYY